MAHIQLFIIITIVFADRAVQNCCFSIVKMCSSLQCPTFAAETRRRNLGSSIIFPTIFETFYSEILGGHQLQFIWFDLPWTIRIAVCDFFLPTGLSSISPTSKNKRQWMKKSLNWDCRWTKYSSYVIKSLNNLLEVKSTITTLYASHSTKTQDWFKYSAILLTSFNWFESTISLHIGHWFVAFKILVNQSKKHSR